MWLGAARADIPVHLMAQIHGLDMEECLVPAHRNQHFQWLGATTEMPKMRKVELTHSSGNQNKGKKNIPEISKEWNKRHGKHAPSLSFCLILSLKMKPICNG